MAAEAHQEISKYRPIAVAAIIAGREASPTGGVLIAERWRRNREYFLPLTSGEKATATPLPHGFDISCAATHTTYRMSSFDHNLYGFFEIFR